MVIRGNFRELKEQEAQETGRKKENSQLLQLLQENRFVPLFLLAAFRLFPGPDFIFFL